MIDYIAKTIELARKNVELGGRAFACIIVQKGNIIAQACNKPSDKT